MRHWKVLSLALVAVFAFGAIAAGATQAAEAPNWRVEEVDLNATQTREFKATSTTGAVLATPELNVTFQNPSGKCTSSGKIRGSEKGQPGTVEAATLTCTEVTVKEAASCKVNSPGQPVGTVKTETLAGTLVWLEETGLQAGVKFKPASSANFVVINVEGCSAEGLYPVTNEIIGKLSPVGKEAEEGTLDFPTPPILTWWNNNMPREKQSITQLAVKNQPATFDTTFKIETSPKELVGVFGH